MNDSDFLEMLNGVMIVPGAIVIGLLVRYLVKEALRRGLHGLDWIHFPAPMNLILSTFIVMVAVLGEKIVKWTWRRFLNVNDLGISESVTLIFFGALLVVGTLCKIRALTHPTYGNWPWLASSSATVIAIAWMLAFR